MNHQEIKQIIENKITELKQIAVQQKQTIKNKLEQKSAEIQGIITTLDSSKESFEAKLSNSRQLLDELDKELDLTQELEDLEQALTQENADIISLCEKFQKNMQERATAYLNDIKVKADLIHQEMETKLAETRQTLLGESAKFEQNMEKCSCTFKAKFGDKLKKAKLMLADLLEFCAVKLKK